MGCIVATASRFNDALFCDANKASGDLNVYAKATHKALNCSADIATDNLNLSAYKIASGLAISCNLVCTVNKSAFLNVKPDIIWLSQEELSSMDFEVISNVRWVIE